MIPIIKQILIKFKKEERKREESRLNNKGIVYVG